MRARGAQRDRYCRAGRRRRRRHHAPDRRSPSTTPRPPTSTIIVAINKMDKPTANPDACKGAAHQVRARPRRLGRRCDLRPRFRHDRHGHQRPAGDASTWWPRCMELKANPNRRAKGAVIEARLDKGQWPHCDHAGPEWYPAYRAMPSLPVLPWAVCVSCATTRAATSRRPVPPCRWRSPA